MKLIFAIVLWTLGAATAGSPEQPEVADASGDCALPYGAAYLDLTRAWIRGENATGFQVAMELARFDDATAEGAAYVVQFEHQGVRWGTLAMFRPVSDSGWAFFTGQIDSERAATDTFQPAVGTFDAGSSPIVTVAFDKAIFPHEHADDRELRGFYAGTADLRTAYPFVLATDSLSPRSSNGRWLVCDEATSDATYTFQEGAHSAHAAEALPSGFQAGAPIEPPVTREPEPPEAMRETPGGQGVLFAALGAACLLRRRAAAPFFRGSPLARR